MNRLLLTTLIITLMLTPFASAYGVTFYSPEQNPQYGKVYEKVEPDKLYDFDVKKDIIAITGIGFRIDNEASSAGITVYTLTSPPDLPGIPETGVYEINELKYTGFVPHDMISATYRFKVAKSWLENASVNRNSVAIHAFDRQTDYWEPLPTRITDDDDDYVFYEADGPGVHYLYIGSSEAVATDMIEEETEPIAPVQESPAPTAGEPKEIVDITADIENVDLARPATQPAPQPAPQPVQQDMPEAAQSEGGFNVMTAFLILAVVVVVVILYLLFGKGKARSSVDKELHNYIKESFKRGKSKDEVRSRLLEVGWHSDRVEKALAKYKDKNSPSTEEPATHHAPVKSEHHATVHKSVKKPAKKKATKK